TRRVGRGDAAWTGDKEVAAAQRVAPRGRVARRIGFAVGICEAFRVRVGRGDGVASWRWGARGYCTQAERGGDSGAAGGAVLAGVDFATARAAANGGLAADGAAGGECRGTRVPAPDQQRRHYGLRHPAAAARTLRLAATQRTTPTGAFQASLADV